jgi:phosphatidate cytidylyltransferase
MRRIISAAALMAIVGLTVWTLPVWATAALASVAAVLAAGELAGIAARVGAPVPPGFVGLAAALLTIAFWMYGVRSPGPYDDLVGAAVLGLLVAAGIVALRLGPPTPATLTQAGFLVLSPIYLGLPLGSLVWTQTVYGAAATTWLVATIAASDTAQYYTGRSLGRVKLAPAISPGKTWEGAMGGLAAAGLSGWFLGPVCLPGLSPASGLVVAVALAAFGMAGDLFESLLKRSAGVKDSSERIPGHGGVLDRLDSYLFAAPAFYLFLRYVR